MDKKIVVAMGGRLFTNAKAAAVWHMGHGGPCETFLLEVPENCPVIGRDGKLTYETDQRLINQL
jgi:hypothetical protein